MNGLRFLLGVDGGGTRCRARLCDLNVRPLGEGEAGPANIRFGIEEGFVAVLQATRQCLAEAGLSEEELADVAACLALAGAYDDRTLADAEAYPHPFGAMRVTMDAHAACVGAHGGRDGGVVIVGTGSVGWGELDGRHVRVGGWGFPLSDEGSGAWIGSEAARRVLWAIDGRIEWTPLLRALMQRFGGAHAVVDWMTGALPRDFAQLAPAVVEHACADDPAAVAIMRVAAGHVDDLARRLIECGVGRLSLVGGLAGHVEPWLPHATAAVLVRPEGDALDGAVRIARELAGSFALAE